MLHNIKDEHRPTIFFVYFKYVLSTSFSDIHANIPVIFFYQKSLNDSFKEEFLNPGIEVMLIV